MKFSQVLAAVVAFSSVSAAWPDLDDVKGVLDAPVLFGRDDSSSASASGSKNDDSATSQSAQSSEKVTATDKATKTTNQASGSGGSKTGSGVTKTPSATNYGADTPAGGISLIEPAITAGSQYYKVGDWVTFAWNYTSLKATPTAVDVLASCSVAQATFTIALNQSVGDSNTVLWDTGAYQKTAKQPLLTETYTLLIYDADSSVSAAAKPGYLAVYDQYQFGMYTPQSYTPWASWTCDNCKKNSGNQIFATGTTKIFLITCGTTLASFLYFAHSFGLL